MCISTYNAHVSSDVRVPVRDPGAGRVWAGQVHAGQLSVPDGCADQRRHLHQAGENQGDPGTQGGENTTSYTIKGCVREEEIVIASVLVSLGVG